VPLGSSAILLDFFRVLHCLAAKSELPHQGEPYIKDRFWSVKKKQKKIAKEIRNSRIKRDRILLQRRD
jgi:hypothetical protein